MHLLNLKWNLLNSRALPQEIVPIVEHLLQNTSQGGGAFESFVPFLFGFRGGKEFKVVFYTWSCSASNIASQCGHWETGRPAEVTSKQRLAGGDVYTELLAFLQVQLSGGIHRSDSSAASACCPPYLNKACCVCTAGLVAVGVPWIP